LFEIAVKPFSTTISTVKEAFLAGWSKQGNALLASFSSNCVTAAIFSTPSRTYLVL
jgi:hypothetical protein